MATPADVRPSGEFQHQAGAAGFLQPQAPEDPAVAWDNPGLLKCPGAQSLLKPNDRSSEGRRSPGQESGSAPSLVGSVCFLDRRRLEEILSPQNPPIPPALLAPSTEAPGA